MSRQVKKFLNQPYPDEDSLRSIIIGAISTSFIVFMVLALFVPFGLSETGSKSTMYAAIFGLISGLTSLIVELFSKYVLKIRRDVADWKFWKWILSTLILIFIITIANYYYGIYAFGWSGSSFYSMIYNTFAVGIFPVVFFGSFNLIRKLKANQLIATEVTYNHPISRAFANVSLPIKNSTKTFEVDPAKIIFLEAMQNYVLIHYLDSNDVIQMETHRNTISFIEGFLKDFGIKRTHRSFLVNPSMIKSVSGNAQGLKLELKHGTYVVPVSRKYIQEFK